MGPVGIIITLDITNGQQVSLRPVGRSGRKIETEIGPGPQAEGPATFPQQATANWHSRPAASPPCPMCCRCRDVRRRFAGSGRRDGSRTSFPDQALLAACQFSFYVARRGAADLRRATC